MSEDINEMNTAFDGENMKSEVIEKSSFDRFGDDLTEEMLGYLSIEAMLKCYSMPEIVRNHLIDCFNTRAKQRPKGEEYSPMCFSLELLPKFENITR